MNPSRAFVIAQLCTFVSSALRGGNQQQRRTNTRIIGGDPAAEGRYSYAISLQQELGHFCGGSLLAPDIVLSAAHCMQNGTEYKAVIGRHYLSSTDGDEVGVKMQIQHPEWNSITIDNDFMILVLDRPTIYDADFLAVSPDIVPIGTAATVMGWGDTHPSEVIQMAAEELMETEVTVLSSEKCKTSSGTVELEYMGYSIGRYDENYYEKITENMVCAQVGREGTCQGDSGGPLVIRSDSGDIQVGVVSWGVSCAHDDFPGVYARVSSQYNWIRKNVCEESSAPPSAFNCDGIAEASTSANLFSEISKAQDFVAGSTQNVTKEWVAIIEENFTYGFGLFNHHNSNANHYISVMNRAGVVHIVDHGGEHPALTSNKITLERNLFSRFRIGFSFFAIGMEHSDDLCVEYEIDDGDITGKKCWSSLRAFDNGRWYDDMGFEFAASDATSLRISFRIDGVGNKDDVLIDSVLFQGQI